MTLAMAMILSLGCTVSTGALKEPAGPLAWPPDEPRIRFEREVTGERGRRSRVFARILTGAVADDLFERPYGVAWSGDDLIVSDPGAGRVTRISPRSRASHSAPSLFRSPIGVAVCAEGIVVSDSILGKVALLDRQLGLVRWVAEGLDRPTGVDCRENRFFVVETRRHRVLVLEPEGPSPARLDPAGGVPSLALLPVDDEEGLRAADAAWSIRALGQRGAGEGRFNFPTAVRVDPGSLWVADSLNFRIQQFEPTNGGFVKSFGRLGDASGEMPRVKGIAVDSQQNLWISDAYLNQIALYRPDGTFLMAFGGEGTEVGQFSFPAGIAARPDGRVAVVDSLNKRVQIFSLLPTRDPRPPGP